MENANVVRGLEAYFAVKDAAGLEQVTKAGALTAAIARRVFRSSMEAVFEEEKSETNAALARTVTQSLDNLEAYKVPRPDTEMFDFGVQPLVQSGGDYNIHITKSGVYNQQQSKDSALSPDVILFSVGARYGPMTALIARSFFVDPTPSQRKLYDAVLRTQETVIKALVPGARLCDVSEKATAILMEAAGDFENAEITVRPNLGHGIGQRARDAYLAINGKNQTVVEPGMVFTVLVAVGNVPIPDAKPKSAQGKLKQYSVVLGDTVVVGSAGQEPQVVTGKMPKAGDDVLYQFEDDEEEDKGRKGSKSKSAINIDGGRDARGRSARLAARQTDLEADEEAKRRRETHQKELLERKVQQAKKRMEQGEGGDDADGDEGAGEDEIARAAPISAFKATAEYPKEARSARISIDKAHDSVLLPLFGTLVPFHISTIKSVIKTEEGQKGYLRINFYSVGQAPGKDCPPAMQAALQAYPQLAYIRTLTFVSRDHRNMNQVVQVIRAMQKKLRTEREEARQAANLVEQQKLVINRDGKVARLQGLSMWPALAGRKTIGTLEAHTNGFRFVSDKTGERIDIIYSNIRHAVFQPCEKEHVVLLHLHLRHPILVNKKKFKDIQFYTEVIESSLAIDNRRRSDMDADELAEEEREERLRIELNKAFKKFVERAEDCFEKDPFAPKGRRALRFDMPQRDLGFNGAPGRDMVFIQPCTDCLVALVDKPPFVVSVDDIEHVFFERVHFNAKNFDMTIIFKAGRREKGEDEFIRVSSVPTQSLETIKTWLDEVAEITFSESVNTYAWKAIIDEFVRQPDFYINGGFTQLDDNADEESDGGEDEESSGFEGSESEDEDDDEDDDDDFSDLVSEEEDESDDYEAEDGEEDSENDWDALERKAAAEDRKRQREEDEYDAKDHKSGSKSGSSGKKSKR
jgi:nucleosome binding factor SPN SPT16 subunit